MRAIANSFPTQSGRGRTSPAEAVAGAIKASQDYSAGLMVAVYNLGSGRFVLNTLHIRDNLRQHPVAGRLLVNLLRYAARDGGKPLAPLRGISTRSSAHWAMWTDA